ncbi:MAG: methylthioribulose 1-phosphate dehydratase [Candidatus Omnitrophica bacterium]|nr:methylthioribulose 1-phosphate dehydratase [Candidatus Omnitrophota bacterium]
MNQIEVSPAHSLCACVAELNRHGWCQGTGGNFSIVTERDPLRILITQSGKEKGSLTPEDLVLVDSQGKPVEGETGKPSAETLLHAVIAELWEDAGCILHTHSIWNTLLGEHFVDRAGMTISGYEMLKGLEGVKTHEHKVHVPILPNTQDMQDLSEQIRFRHSRNRDLHGFLIAGHGLYTWGETLEQAHRHVEIFEFLFELVGRRTTFRPYNPSP